MIFSNCIMIFSNSLFANATWIFYMQFELLKQVLFVSYQQKSWIDKYIDNWV